MKQVDHIQRPEPRGLDRGAWRDLLLLSLIWGGSFMAFAVALREVGVFTVVLHRVAWAAAALWCLVWWRGVPVPRDLGAWGGFLGMGVLNNLIPFSLIAWGQTTIESGLTSILNASTALFGVVVPAIAFRDERLTVRRVAGLMIGFSGVVVTMGVGNLAAFDLKALAQLAILGAGLSYALASVWGRRFLTGHPPIMAATGMLTGATVLLVPLALWMDGLPSLDLHVDTVLALGYIALPATAGAYLLFYRILRVAGAGNLMLVTLLVPVTAVVLGALFLGEALPLASFAGFALLALGLLVLDGRIFVGKRPSR